ncbi:MAG: YARHG domain-containing protein [Lachnospiraceae bacterium]|nr:YARHG domain-containing protein [Lachnospiraceae bacterium]
MICPNCNNENDEDALFCVYCGMKIEYPAAPEVTYCVYCGEPLEPGALFCSSCGQKVYVEGEDETTVHQETPSYEPEIPSYEPESYASEQETEYEEFSDEAPTTILNQSMYNEQEHHGDTADLVELPPKPEFINNPIPASNKATDDSYSWGEPVAVKKNGSNVGVKAAIIVLCLAVLGVGGYFVKVNILDKRDADTGVVDASSETSDIPEGDEVALTPDDTASTEAAITSEGVDYDLTATPQLTFTGLVKPENGTHFIEWKNPLSFYGTDENGAPARLDGQTRAYIEEAVLTPGILDTYSADESMNINGTITIAGGVLHITPVAITDASGADRMTVAAATEAPAPEPAPEPETPDYILPQSDTALLTYEEIAALDYDTLDLAYQEIVARHGFKFSQKKYSSYFESKSWYTPSVSKKDFDKDKMLSELEKVNRKLIKQRLKELKQDAEPAE